MRKTQTKRTSRVLKEFVENNTHGFDNRKGSSHVSGVYRWVDKIYKNKLVNYGKRLMYEFAIPEPARFLKDAIWKQIDETGQTTSAIIIPEPPKHPKENNIVSANSITIGNYQQKAAFYSADVSTPPVEEMYIGKAFSYQGIPGDGNYNENTSEGIELEIPEGYYTTHAQADWFDSRDSAINNSVVIVGDQQVHNGIADIPIRKFTGNIPISTSQLGHLSGNINVSIKLARLPEALEQWKNDTYNAIMEAYYERLREYNEAIQTDEITRTGDKVKLTFNPAENRSLEKKEIKRIAVQLLAAPYEVQTAKNNYKGSDLFDIERDEAFQKHAATVKFFEQAFDWDIMSYIFYPYMYGDKDDWRDLFQQQEAADPIFQAFLQSGMARAVVPVRPGFEDAVNWYMETGETWNGLGMVADLDDDTYVSIAEEMQNYRR